MLQTWDFPGGSGVKDPPASGGDEGLILGWGRCPGGGNGNPLQCSCLGNPMDRGAWRATVHGVTKSQTGLRLSTFVGYRLDGRVDKVKGFLVMGLPEDLGKGEEG